MGNSAKNSTGRQKYEVVHYNKGDKTLQCLCTGIEKRPQSNDIQCCHCYAASMLRDDEERSSGDHDYSQQEALERCVDKVDKDTYAVFCGGNYAVVILKRNGTAACCSCSLPSSPCAHVEAFKSWCVEHDIPEHPLNDDNDDDSHFHASCQSTHVKSSKPLHYPPRHVKDNINYMRKMAYVPEITGSERCSHGNCWRKEDPVSMSWIRCRGVIVYTLTETFETDAQGILLHIREQMVIVIFFCLVYFRPSTGSCGCEMEYDGSEDFLFNVTGKYMIHHKLLYHYLHLRRG